MDGSDDLFLNGNRLSGTIPTELGNMGKAEIMSFHVNRFEGSIPAEICALDLENLKLDCYVNCACCKIDNIIRC